MFPCISWHTVSVNKQFLLMTVGLRAVPEIILGGATFFSDPSTPRTNMESEPPWPPGHVSALINPPHYGSNMLWPPGQVIPPPLGHVNKHPPFTGQKSACGPPPTPEDNFWNSPKWTAECTIVLYMYTASSLQVPMVALSHTSWINTLVPPRGEQFVLLLTKADHGIKSAFCHLQWRRGVCTQGYWPTAARPLELSDQTFQSLFMSNLAVLTANWQ